MVKKSPKKSKVKYPSDREISRLQIVEKYKKRPSPPYHAANAPNWVMKGNNGFYYLSKQNKAGIYQWKKLKMDDEQDYTKSAYEYYSQFEDYTAKYNVKDFIKKTKQVAKVLLKHNIYFLYIGWKNVRDFIDYAWDDAKEYVKKKCNEECSVIFYTNYRLFWAEYMTGEVFMQHDILKKDKDIVVETFKKYFGKSFSWTGSNRKALLVKLPGLKK